MPESDGTEPVANDEILYRSISIRSRWYDPNQHPPINYIAFTPKKHDRKGISLWRQKYIKTSREAAAKGRQGSEYYVAVLRAGDLSDRGIEVVPTPHTGEGGVGHSSIPVLNYGDRRSGRVMELARLIVAELCLRVEGPFPGQKQVD